MTILDTLSIVRLQDVPHAVPVLELWFHNDWADWYGPEGPGDARADLEACLHGAPLPLCVVALADDGTPLGTAALKSDSAGSDIAPGPWLAALLVAAPYRRRGIASALVAAIETEAARLGYDPVYAATETAHEILMRRNWCRLGTSRAQGSSIAVYRRDLTGTA